MAIEAQGATKKQHEGITVDIMAKDAELGVGSTNW